MQDRAVDPVVTHLVAGYVWLVRPGVGRAQDFSGMLRVSIWELICLFLVRPTKESFSVKRANRVPDNECTPEQFLIAPFQLDKTNLASSPKNPITRWLRIVRGYWRNVAQR